MSGKTTYAEGFERCIHSLSATEWKFAAGSRRDVTASLQFTLASWSVKYILIDELYVGDELCAVKVPGTLVSDDRSLERYAPLLLTTAATDLAMVLGRPPYLIRDHVGKDITVVLRNLTANPVQVYGAIIEVAERS
jgi:hypothetical protein